MGVTTIPTPHAFKDKVLKGVAWFDEHAPADWKYNFFGSVNGRLIFKMSLLSATESPLPLAFKGKNITTHMSHVGICAHFKLSLSDLISHAFHAGSLQYVKSIEKAWEEILREKIEEDEFFTEDGSMR